MTEVKLDHPGGQLSMPVHPAVEGPAGIGVSKLLKETGMTTYDPGFVNTAAASSAITYIDGDAGILRYRGTRSSSWPRSPPSWRSPTCSSTVSCRPSSS